MTQKPATLAEGLFNRSRSRRRIQHTYESNQSIPNDSRSTARRALDQEAHGGRPRPHSMHLEFDDATIQLVRLRQENAELRESLRLERKESTKLRALNDELGQKLNDCQREKELRENDFSTRTKRSKFASIVDVLQLKFKNRPPKEALKQKHIFQNEPCFDNDLEKIMLHENHRNLPKVLVECISLLERNDEHMKTCGLYRVSGNHTIIQKLRFKIDSNNYKLLYEQRDPHNLTGVVKLFFRELKSPIISLSQLDHAIPDANEFLINSNRAIQIEKVKILFKMLPKINQDTLEYLIIHIAKVANIPENSMTAHTLSIVVGAFIFYETMQDLDILNNLNRCMLPNKCIEIMIECNEEIFNG